MIILLGMWHRENKDNIEISVLIGLLLISDAVDFVVTGALQGRERL